jgi:hypothetical protein
LMNVKIASSQRRKTSDRINFWLESGFMGLPLSFAL